VRYDGRPHDQYNVLRFAISYTSRNVAPIRTLSVLTVVVLVLSLFVSLFGLAVRLATDTQGLLVVAGVLAVAPVVVVVGYATVLLSEAIRGADWPPAVTAYRALGVEGLFTLFALLPFLLVGSMLGSALGPVTTPAGALVGAVAAYCLPAVLLRYTATGSLGQTYDLRALTSLVGSTSYLGYFLLYLVVLAVLGVVAGGLFATVIGIVAVPALLCVPSASYWGYVGFRLLDADDIAEDDVPTPPARGPERQSAAEPSPAAHGGEQW
jgi:hypothetical protein